MTKFHFALISVLSLSLLSQAKADHTEWGDPQKLGSGTVRSFVVEDSKGVPVEIGVELSRKSLLSLPDMHQEMTLRLPAGSSVAPYDHIGINWNPQGHEPIEIYGAPHFDFHFYTISESTRHHITCEDEDARICIQMPDPGNIAPAYAPTPAGLPMMGWHWVDTLSPEFHGKPFTSTFIYGYYAGKIAFVEPMITRAFLLTHPRQSYSVRVPEKAFPAGTYPQEYRVEYHPLKRVYRIRLVLP